ELTFLALVGRRLSLCRAAQEAGIRLQARNTRPRRSHPDVLREKHPYIHVATAQPPAVPVVTHTRRRGALPPSDGLPRPRERPPLQCSRKPECPAVDAPVAPRYLASASR